MTCVTIDGMDIEVNGARIELVKGNIVEQEVDAIVNAANTKLLGGGGVDGAIHRAAGPELLEECRALPEDEEGRRCPTGEVRVTEGYDLPARLVIHGVGPVYDEARATRADALLRKVHEGALVAARERECRSVAFPAISTGVYRFPVDRAASIALATTREFLGGSPGSVELVRFVLFSDGHLAAFEAAAAAG